MIGVTQSRSKDLTKKKVVTKTSIIDHTYRDYSHVEISDLVEHYKGVNHELFPSKLQRILSTPAYAPIIAWKPHGRAWAVLNKALFTSMVLPTHFNHSKFESFNRSVNGWGFKRLSREGPDHGAYYHEFFLCGRLDLTSAMVRLINPGKRLPNKAAEPDFYAISKKYPLSDPPPSHLPEDEEPNSRKKRCHPPPISSSPADTNHFRLHSMQDAPHRGYYSYHSPCLQPPSHSQPQPNPTDPHPHHRSSNWQDLPHHGYDAVPRPQLPPPSPVSYLQHQPCPPTAPHLQHSPYAQHPSHSHHPLHPRAPQHAQHPSYSQPQSNDIISTPGAHHSHPGYFCHPHTAYAARPSGHHSIPFHHSSLWDRAHLPPHERQPSYPADIQHTKGCNPNTMMPILHSPNYPRGYPAQSSTVAEKNESDRVHDERKHLTDNAPKPDRYKHQELTIEGALTGAPQPQLLERPKLEDHYFNENAFDPPVTERKY